MSRVASNQVRRSGLVPVHGVDSKPKALAAPEEAVTVGRILPLPTVAHSRIGKPHPGVAISLVAKRFGNWTVLRRAKSLPPHYRGRWLCRCVCGTEREIYAHSLEHSTSKSCGCTRQQASQLTWLGRRKRQEHLQRSLAYFQHQDGCELLEWSDPRDHITTSFGFVITSRTCSCGAIALACELDPAAAARLSKE